MFACGIVCYTFCVFRMPLTRDQRDDFKALFKECINDLLKSEDFFDKMSAHVSLKLDKKIEAVLKTNTEAHGRLEKENHILKSRIDELEQYSRKNSVRVFGVPWEDNENLEARMLNIFNTKLNISMGPEHIDNCHRIGRLVDGKQAIIIKFAKHNYKQLILKNSPRIKGDKIFFAEDLTQERFKLLKAAKKKFDSKNLWTANGIINVRSGTKKFKIKNMLDLQKLDCDAINLMSVNS